jgi:hypothetical protein
MKKLLSIILCLPFMLLINNDCFAQDDTDTKSAQHTVYVEGLGNAGFYSYSSISLLYIIEIHITLHAIELKNAHAIFHHYPGL